MARCISRLLGERKIYMDKLDKLLKEQYSEQKEKYDVEKIQEEMMRLIREEAVDNIVDKSFDTEKE